MIAVSIPNHFQTTRFRTLRACVFSGLGLWGAVPVLHQLFVYWDVWAIRQAFVLDALMGALYLVSLIVLWGCFAPPRPCAPLLPPPTSPLPAPPPPSTWASLSPMQPASQCAGCQTNPNSCATATSITPPNLYPPPPPQGGAFIYAARIPERWMPGKLDLLGHSHQIWHLTVVLAALVHYKAILVLLQWRDASGGCAANLHAHVPTVLQEIQAGGGQALAIEQVWQNLSAQLHEFVGVPAGVQQPVMLPA